MLEKTGILAKSMLMTCSVGALYFQSKTASSVEQNPLLNRINLCTDSVDHYLKFSSDITEQIEIVKWMIFSQTLLSSTGNVIRVAFATKNLIVQRT